MPDPTSRREQLLKALQGDTDAPSPGPLLSRPPRAPDVALPKQGPLGLFDKVAALLTGAVGVNEPDPADYLTTDNYQQAMRYHGAGELGSLAAGPIIGGAKALTTSAEEAIPKMIKAFHGSPASFDKFDAAKIGTGEGSQAYTYGHYLAEHPQVAETYKELSPMVVKTPTAQYEMPSRLSALDPVKDRARLEEALAQKTAELAGWESSPGVAKLDYMQAPVNDSRRIKAGLEALLSGEGQLTRGGHMYEVGLRASPEDLLDLDKPFSQQSPQVQRAIRTVFPDLATPSGHVPEMTGREIYQLLAESKANPRTSIGHLGKAGGPAASEALRKEGVVGSRYLDRGSRETGEGTRNYVVYPGNEHLIEIAKKYGVALPVAAEIFRRQQQTTAEPSTPQQ